MSSRQQGSVCGWRYCGNHRQIISFVGRLLQLICLFIDSGDVGISHSFGSIILASCSQRTHTAECVRRRLAKRKINSSDALSTGYFDRTRQLESVHSECAMQADSIGATEHVAEPQRSRFVLAIRRWIIRIGDHLVKYCFQPLQDFFASVQRASKRDNNNRTPGEGTCFELGKFGRHTEMALFVGCFSFFFFIEVFLFAENTRSCWPVRPIPRKNLIADNQPNNQSESTPSPTISGITPINSHHLPASNAAIGVVIPRTPNSTVLHHHQNQLNETAVSGASNMIRRWTGSECQFFLLNWRTHTRNIALLHLAAAATTVQPAIIIDAHTGWCATTNKASHENCAAEWNWPSSQCGRSAWLHTGLYSSHNIDTRVDERWKGMHFLCLCAVEWMYSVGNGAYAHRWFSLESASAKDAKLALKCSNEINGLVDCRWPLVGASPQKRCSSHHTGHTGSRCLKIETLHFENVLQRPYKCKQCICIWIYIKIRAKQMRTLLDLTMGSRCTNQPNTIF